MSFWSSSRIARSATCWWPVRPRGRQDGLRTKDGEEVNEAGQAPYWSPGHAPNALEDSKYVEFSPTSGLNELIDHIKPQLA